LWRITAEAKLGKNSKVRSSLLGLSRQAHDARGIPCEVANGGIELRERYFHARALGYGWNPKIANIAASQCDSFTGNLPSPLLATLFGDQAGDSLPGAQFAVEQNTQAWECLPELADFEEVSRIPRPTRKFKLRACESLEQQNAIRAKGADHLWKERSLQKLYAHN